MPSSATNSLVRGDFFMSREKDSALTRDQSTSNGVADGLGLARRARRDMENNEGDTTCRRDFLFPYRERKARAMRVARPGSGANPGNP
jgi:hypothetical protein